MAERKHFLQLTEEEVRRGEWRKDPEFVRQAAQMSKLVIRAMAEMIAEMPEEKREEFIREHDWPDTLREIE